MAAIPQTPTVVVAPRLTAPGSWAWLPVAAVLLGTGWGSNQFTPLLLVYRHTLGLGAGTLEAMFGLYALGLIPGLLLAGPFSDARGRRPAVLAAAGVSLVGSVVLAAGGHSVELLSIGRLLAGLSNGVAFAAGTAWLREFSLPPIGTATPSGAARRAAVAMTTGFAVGPLVAGTLAQWAPAPTVLPYLPHIVLMALALPRLVKVPETVHGDGRRVRLSVAGLRSSRFRRVVAPMAPWVFTAPAVAFALLPSILGAEQTRDGITLAAAIATLTSLAGIAIQPLARRLDSHAAGSNRAGTIGLLVLGGGLALAAVAAHVGELWLLVPCALTLGAGYGLCLVAGLIEVQRIASGEQLGALTATYYALTYLGFAAPYLLTLAAQFASYPVLLLLAAGLALATATLITRRSARHLESPVAGRT